MGDIIVYIFLNPVIAKSQNRKLDTLEGFRQNENIITQIYIEYYI